MFCQLFPEFVATAAVDLEAAVVNGSEPSTAECWICRDITDEPLIQPCRQILMRCQSETVIQILI